MAAAPNFFNVTKTPMVQIATANTNRDGTGTLGTLVTAGAGAPVMVQDVTITATGTTTAGVIRMFVSDGTNHRLHSEILVTPVTPSTTIAVWSFQLFNLGIQLEAGYSLRFSTNNAETFNVIGTRVGAAA